MIVSLCVLERGRLQRSTAELSRACEVRQHRGARNEEPPEICQRALEVCLRRWRRGVRSDG